MINKLLILGGGGFIGTNYYKNHSSFFDKIVIVDWYIKPTHEDPYLRRFLELQLRETDELIICDIYDSAKYEKHISDSNFIYILNADTGTGLSYFSPYNSTKFNGSSVAFISQLILSKNAKLESLNIFFASSRAIYGEGDWICREHGSQIILRSQYLKCSNGPSCYACGKPLSLGGFDEHTFAKPTSIYGLNKLFSENLLNILFKNKVNKLGIIRFQNVYGAGQSRKNPYTGVLNWFTESLMSDSKVEIYENGHILRDFIYVDDASKAIHLTMTNFQSNYSVYSVGSGYGIKLISVAQKLKEMLNSNSDIIVTDQFREGDVLGAFSNNFSIQSDLEFNCSFSIETGLEKYVSWFLND